MKYFYPNGPPLEFVKPLPGKANQTVPSLWVSDLRISDFGKSAFRNFRALLTFYA